MLPSAFSVDKFWNLDFGKGEFRVSSTSEQRYYRCVRSPAQPRCYRTRYEAVDSAVIAGAVKDNATGLIWQRDSGATTYTWSEAKTVCGFRGVGWRLPSVAELQSITDDTRVEPAIDTSVFQVGSTKRSYFWSSTPLTGNPARAWAVATDSDASNVAIGQAYANDVTSTYKARCVQ